MYVQFLLLSSSLYIHLHFQLLGSSTLLCIEKLNSIQNQTIIRYAKLTEGGGSYFSTDFTAR